MAEEKIRVLIVDDIPETRENLRKLLYFESDIEVVAAASSGEEGIAFAKEYQPDIVLMDINMPGIDGITASEAIVQEVPTTQIIMMSVQSEADYLRRSMLAGARDFLTKPFTGDELVTTIRRVYEMGKSRRAILPPAQPAMTVPTAAVAAPPPPQGKLIAVFSPKGGVGCTTIAVNLAIGLIQTPDDKVALVDANLQFGDVAVMLNLQAAHSIADLAPQIEEMDYDMLETVLMPHSSGLRALLAPPRPEMADLVLPEHVKRILTTLKERYDYVVVDTGSALNDMTLVVLDAADRIVLPATPDIAALKDARLFFEVTEVLEYPPEKTMLVLNRQDRRSGISASDIEESIKHPVAAQIPPDERTALAAVNRGVPFVLSDRNRPISQSILALARQIVQDLEAVAEGEKPQPVVERTPGRPTERKGLGRFFR